MSLEAFNLSIQKSYDAEREDMLKSRKTWRSYLKYIFDHFIGYSLSMNKMGSQSTSNNNGKTI